MKEEKFFDIVNDIDDDLICEMLEYSPDKETKGGEYKGTLYPAHEKAKRVRYWQYPVTAAVVILAAVGALFIFNMGDTLPYEQQPGTATTDDIDLSPLELINCRLCDDGKYRVDEKDFTVTDDYDLFRQYFFGTWEGSFCFAESYERDSLVIDDSLKSFNMTGLEPWFDGVFYKVKDNVLAFICGSSEGGSTLWLDMNAPGTMYLSWGCMGDYETQWFYSRDGEGRPADTPALYTLKKTDIPPNEPEENFLSIFRLREISRDHGIDFDLLVNIEGISEDATERVCHDDKAHFYPVYLVSESADKLVFETRIGNVLAENSENLELGVTYTIEKADGMWVTTVDIHYVDDPRVPVDTNVLYEFTEEDRELQKFLEDTVLEAEKFSQLYYSGSFGDIGYSAEGDGVILVRFPQMEKALDKQINDHYAILSDELPFKTAAELEASLKQYYSAEIVSRCMAHVAVGEVIPSNTEEYYTVEIRERGYFDENGFLYAAPTFIELNGRLYRAVSERGGGFTPNWSMVKVISKTDDVLIFSFLGYDMYDIKEICAGLGRLKYEDGWKYDWWDICNPYERVDYKEAYEIFGEDGICFQAVSYCAAAAFLRNDREELSVYLADPGYEALSEGSENLYDRVANMTCDLSGMTEKDGVYSVTYKIAVENAEMLINLDLGLKKIGDEWKVEYIYLQG